MLVPVLVTALALGLLVIALLMRHKGLILVSAVLVLANANWSSVNQLTGEAGFGAAAVLICIVLLFLIVGFGLSLFAVPRSLVQGPGILLFVTLYYIAFIAPGASIAPLVSVRTSISFVLVCLLGWYVFGKVFAQRPDLARQSVFTIIYVVAVNGLIVLMATAILIGPSARRGAIGGVGSRIAVGTVTVSRLQDESFNATGLAMLAAGALFAIAHWYAVSKHSLSRKAWLGALAGTTAMLLLWTGGRAAILAFIGTAACLAILASAKNGKKALRSLILLLAASVAIFLLRDYYMGIFWRGSYSPEVYGSLVDIFLRARIEDSLAALRYYGDNIILGNGTGILIRSPFNPESFFFRVLIELGVVGGLLYTVTFLWLTYYVLRVDLHYIRLRQRGAWLPSSVFLFAWIISPASYGFSLFTGALALQLAIAAGSVVEWDEIKRRAARRFNDIE